MRQQKKGFNFKWFLKISKIFIQNEKFYCVTYIAASYEKTKKKRNAIKIISIRSLVLFNFETVINAHIVPVQCWLSKHQKYSMKLKQQLKNKQQYIMFICQTINIQFKFSSDNLKYTIKEYEEGKNITENCGILIKLTSECQDFPLSQF